MALSKSIKLFVSILQISRLKQCMFFPTEVFGGTEICDCSTHKWVLVKRFEDVRQFFSSLLLWKESRLAVAKDTNDVVCFA